MRLPTAASSPASSAITSAKLAPFQPSTSGSVARGYPPPPAPTPPPARRRSRPSLCSRHRRPHRPRQDGVGEGPHRGRPRPLGGREAPWHHDRPPLPPPPVGGPPPGQRC